MGFTGGICSTDGKRTIGMLNNNTAAQLLGQITQGALDGDLACHKAYLDTGWHGNRILSYAGHVSTSGNYAQNFATHTQGARFAVSHHALGRGNNGNT